MATNPVTLDEVIDSAMQLPADQQEMLISILYKRQIEARRLRELVLSPKFKRAFRKFVKKDSALQRRVEEILIHVTQSQYPPPEAKAIRLPSDAP